MTVIRDERDTARAARQVALQRAATAAAELATIPGWLLVGAPERLADPALRNTAWRSIELRGELDRIHRGIAALDAELDALDGPTTASIHLFLEWSRWLESLPDAATLLRELVPDPRRQFLGSPPAMSADTAQRIIDAVAANGGHVGSGDPFVAAAGLEDDDVWDLYHTARRRLDPLVPGHVLGVLLPMRLETRYTRPAAAGDPWRLRIRVHPDPIALAGAPLPATQPEADLVAACWTACGGDLSTDDGAAAFRALVGSVGGPRAAYLLRSVSVVPDGDGFRVTRAYTQPGDRRSPQRVALPKVLQVWGDAGAGLRLLGELEPKRAQIAAQAHLGDAMQGITAGKVPDVWWTSYAAALDVGLAREVELPDGPHLDVLMVTGLSEISTRPVFEAHAAHGDLGIVAPMSPSNTVAGQPAADLGRDPASWLAVARAAGSGTASGLSAVLTGSPRLTGVPTGAATGGTTPLDAVPTLVTALWPVLWQRWLKDVEHAAEIYALGDWAARLLSPLGPFPAIRVGEVPYGVLPAVDHAAWVPAPHDPVWEEAITFVAGRVLPAWASAGSAGGTAAGANAEQLLDIIGRIPTSREIGSRQFPPLEALALVKALIDGTDPAQTVANWEAMAAPALDVEPPPHRRYQAFGRVQPAARAERALAEVIEEYLSMPCESLAYGGARVEEGAPLLARLLRHSLLLTVAEAGRLGETFPTWAPPYELPLHGAERLAQDAAFGNPVVELPQVAIDRLAEHPPDPRAVAVARQFRDVREAARTLAGHDTALAPGGPLFPAVAAVLDASSHRFDPWVTGVGTRRLRRFVARQVPPRIGAYGWVDNLDPAVDPTPPTTAGFLHAPGSTQALAAAVLRDHAINDSDDRWRMDVRSDLARLAARLAGDVRLGVHLSEALGREIERRAGDPAIVLELRRRFPARPEWAGRRVCDGQQVLAAPAGDVPAGIGVLDDLRQVIDTYGDLLVADAVHDVVSGRGAVANEAMEAAAGLAAPAELRLLRTRREGTSVRTTVLVALSPGTTDPASPITIADPHLAALLESELGPAVDWTWTTDDASVSLADLGLTVADVVLQPQARLDARAAATLGAEPSGGTAGVRRADLDRLCSLLGTQDVMEGHEAELRDRLATLRAAAAALDVVADPAAGRRWGLPDGDADALDARVSAAGDAASDATADAHALGARIRALLAPASGLPLVGTAPLPPLVAAIDLDERWLEIVAAVRPALARLEAHQLRVSWPAAATDPERLWTVPAPSQHDVVAYGPAVGAAGPVGLAVLDDWAETVPGTRHATHAAFGFDAPRARAPQAVLLAVPPDEQRPLTADALPSIVLATRQLARARMAQPDQLGQWSLAVPTSMVLTSGPAAATLVEPT